MDWIKAIAPSLGTALLGPLGGAAASFLATKLGVSEKSVEAVTELLNSNNLAPEQIEAIKLAEIEFNKFLESNKIKLAELNVENTKDARAMQVATRAKTPSVLSYVVVIGFFGILGSMLVYDYKPTEPLLILLGALGAGFGAVINFWLGSSHGSQLKTEQLSK